MLISMKPKTNYAHPKCYAKKTNDCSTTISGEHYISESVLELFKTKETVKITGVKWIPQETFKIVGINSLTANILCTKHNSDLSQCDSAALSLFKSIKDFDADFNSATPKADHVQIDGELLEQWMLKTVVGLIASKQTVSNGVVDSVILKDIYIDILFNGAPWPEQWGLYFKPPTDKIHKFDSAGVTFAIGNNEVKAAIFTVQNFTFYLLLGVPDVPGSFGIHRINNFYFRQGTIVKQLELKWSDKKYSHWLEFTRQGTYDGHPPDWKEWEKK